MMNKIEQDFEHSPMVRDRSSCQTSCIDVDGNIPEVVFQRSESQTYFPDNLGPHMQRVKRICPFLKRQGRPIFLFLVHQVNSPHARGQSGCCPVSTDASELCANDARLSAALFAGRASFPTCRRSSI